MNETSETAPEMDREPWGLDEDELSLREALRRVERRVRAEVDVRRHVAAHAGTLVLVGLCLGIWLGSRPSRALGRQRARGGWTP